MWVLEKNKWIGIVEKSSYNRSQQLFAKFIKILDMCKSFPEFKSTVFPSEKRDERGVFEVFSVGCPLLRWGCLIKRIA